MISDIKLTYFDSAGRAEVARLCFHLGGIKFTDERLSYEKFQQQKSQGKFKFGQVPVLNVNGTQYAQSGAINRYAAKLANLYPNDPIEALKVEQAILTVDEVVSRFVSTFFIQDKNKQLQARQQLAQNEFPQWFQRLEGLIKENNTVYVSGNSITLGDLQIYDLVKKVITGGFPGFPEDYIKSYQLLERHYNVIKLNKKIQEWDATHQN